MFFQSTGLPDLLWGWVMAQENAGLTSKRFRYGTVVDQFTKEIMRLHHTSGPLMHRCHDYLLALRLTWRAVCSPSEPVSDQTRHLSLALAS